MDYTDHDVGCPQKLGKSIGASNHTNSYNLEHLPHIYYPQPPSALTGIVITSYVQPAV